MKKGVGNSLIVTSGFMLMTVLVFTAVTVFAQETPTDCDACRAGWEKLVQNLKEKVEQFEAIKKTPVEKITKKPLVDSHSDRTIARQIADALQSKEDQLNTKRKECLSLLNQEEQAFAELERCALGEKGNTRKDAKKLVAARNKLVQKARHITVEVQEVEGKNGQNYVDSSWRGPYEGMSRQMRNYWNY